MPEPELEPEAPNSAVEACAACTGLCQTCPLDGDEWPDRTQDDIATAEATGLAYAGADAPRPHEAIDRATERHDAWRTTTHNRHHYGNGGLFDHLPTGDAA